MQPARRLSLARPEPPSVQAKDLIEKVLGTIEGEIKRHFEEKPGKAFKRVGKMSVLFNRDYYCLQIDDEGRLVTLYVTG